MCDIFDGRDVRRLFEGMFIPELGRFVTPGKSVLMMGDSLMRCMYKDLLYLANPANNSQLTPVEHYRDNREPEYQHDRLLNRTYGLQHGRAFREERDFWSGYQDARTDMQVSYVFITSCFGAYIQEFFEKYPLKYGSYPDVIMINSALWDINRWGGKGIEKFKRNMIRLMELLKTVLPQYTQVIWMTTPPISVDIRGGFQLNHLDFQRHSMRFNVMESNVYAANVVAAAGYDVLDMHYHTHKCVYRRAGDGIHWNPDGVRYQTNLWLTHYCLSQETPLPRKWKVSETQPDEVNMNLQEAIHLARVADDDYLPLPEPPEEEAEPNKGRKFKKAKRKGGRGFSAAGPKGQTTP